MWLSFTVKAERAVIHLLFVLTALSVNSFSFSDSFMLNNADWSLLL